MEYQLIKIAKTHHCVRGEVVSAVSYFNYHSLRNNHTSGSLLAGSTRWPFRIMPRFDSDDLGQTQIVSTSMHSSLATC